jgi:hypothetical protein
MSEKEIRAMNKYRWVIVLVVVMLALLGCKGSDTVPPTVVNTNLHIGSQDIDTGLMEITATFSEAMMDKSWSWVYEQQDKFPAITDLSYDSRYTIVTHRLNLSPTKNM